MKRTILSLAVVAAIVFTSCKSETKKETETATETTKDLALANTSFGVRGNCGMCKSTIEKAASSVEGVANATWDKNKKTIDVAFNSDKTNEMAIHKAIAASGYDTDKVSGNEDAYKNLPGCCQYDHEMELGK
ncbi:heavy metal transporter [Tamlana nanhaiensis]|uniref:Heavy metal transporter n=1 Tax=Neotamlana nanhaiensis TaxID=1382798 RepID=A0A0D7W5W2_9FLAO|nr:heavy-metal-associated domain-containing protein [Tamlana nanhaiensis]KJD34505.1 heavy metal transporter [Tamlana nanhaiensis]